MAIGDYGNNGSSRGGYQNNSSNGNKVYEPTYYSRFRIRNDKENKTLTISYRSALMIIEINDVDATNGYKPIPAISLYLTGMKANMLVKEIDAFKAYKEAGDTDPQKAFGVITGSGDKITYIGFSTDDGTNTKINIGKFDGTGQVTESHSITLPMEYNYSIEWNNIEANDLVKVYRDDMDLDILKNALADFGRSFTGGLGYGALDLNRYEQNKDRRSIDQIFDRLGIERRSYNNNNYNSTNNFLNNAASSKITSLDEIGENLLED